MLFCTLNNFSVIFNDTQFFQNLWKLFISTLQMLVSDYFLRLSIYYFILFLLFSFMYGAVMWDHFGSWNSLR